MPSRCQLFTTAAGGLAACLLLNIAMAQTPNITVHSPLAWLQITPASEVEAQQLLGADVINQIRPVLLYSVIVTNQGTVNIDAIAMRWEIDYPGRPGEPVVRHFFWNNQPGQAVIPAGARRLFTPLKQATAMATLAVIPPGQKAGGGQPGYSPGSDSARDLNSLRMSTGMDVSIDLAVDSHGNSAGQDKGHTIDMQAFALQDYIQMRTQMLTRLNQGDSDQALIDWLTPLAAAPLVVEKGPRKFVSLAVQSGPLARQWLKQIQAGHRADIETHLKAETPEVMFPLAVILKSGGLQ
jgi:hypothetical protein